VGAAVHAAACRRRPALPTSRGRSLAGGRDLCQGRRPLALCLPAIDQFRQVIDVFVASRRDTKAAHRFFERAIGTTKITPAEVTTDQAPMYPAVLEDLLPAAWHRTDRYTNNRVECDHGRLKARPRPMRGRKQDRSGRVIIAGHAFVQNLRRGHYELAVDEPTNRRVAVAFDELVLAI
jgi:transposase-like protein